MSASPEMNCSACGKPPEGSSSENNLKKCSVCASAHYCSVECQRSDWPNHKATCTKTAVLKLFQAIQEDDTATIQRLAKTKRVVNGKVDYTPTDWENATEMGNWTPLHECIRKGNPHAMQLLIDGGVANLNVQDIDGESPVFVASTNPKPDCLQTLLDAGAGPDAVAGDGFSALMVAARGGYRENVKLLLQAGANMRVGSDMFGRGALELAAFQASGQGGLRMREGETLEHAREQSRQIRQLLLLEASSTVA